MSLRYILLLIILNSTLSKIRTKCIETLLRTKTKNVKFSHMINQVIKFNM